MPRPISYAVFCLKKKSWKLPPSYHNYCATWMEITVNDGELILYCSHPHNWLNTVHGHTQFPMLTLLMVQLHHRFTLFPYTTLFRSITFLKASHSFRNRLLVICKNAYLFATMIMTSVSSPFSCCSGIVRLNLM